MKALKDLPSALEEQEAIWKRIKGHQLVIFLDYDGTLTPIVSQPERALLTSSMRATLQELASYYTIAIVSGRDLRDLIKRIGVDNIFYAGSHGFEIVGPGGLKKELDAAEALLGSLNQIEAQLQLAIKPFKGALIERKHFSIAIHYRNVKDESQEPFKQSIEAMCRNLHGFKLTHGKKVLELLPNIDWHKGKAILWLLDQLPLKSNSIFSIYIGDDLTDEDAFRALNDKGLGIVIRGGTHESSADYALNDPNEVQLFLQEIIKREI
ncbi:MAG: trehalose-phosphatase [Chlamydiales bacterium]